MKSFVGNGIRLLIERACRAGLLIRIFWISSGEFKRFYAEHCCDATKPYDGVLEMLRELKRTGKKAAIVSNKADFAVKELAKRYFGALTEAAVGENEAAGIRKKPAPDSVFSVLTLLNADRGKAVYIGDSEVDIETAENAGLPCISVTWGFKTEAFLPGARGAAARPFACGNFRIIPFPAADEENARFISFRLFYLVLRI